MNCFQIEVRGITFTIWAPTIQDALETFMIDMDFFEEIENLKYAHAEATKKLRAYEAAEGGRAGRGY